MRAKGAILQIHTRVNEEDARYAKCKNNCSFILLIVLLEVIVVGRSGTCSCWEEESLLLPERRAEDSVEWLNSGVDDVAVGFTLYIMLVMSRRGSET